MKLQKLFLFFFTINLFFGCASKKTITEYKDKIVRDTIYKNITKTVLKPIKDTLLIEQPCDTNGVLKPFKTTLKNEKATVIIENIKGNIKATVNIDSILQVKELEYKSKYKSKVEIKEKEIIRYKTPFWVWIYIVLSLLIIALLLRLN